MKGKLYTRVPVLQRW